LARYAEAGREWAVKVYAQLPSRGMRLTEAQKTTIREMRAEELARASAAPAGPKPRQELTELGKWVFAEHRATRRWYGAKLHDVPPAALEIFAANQIGERAELVAAEERQHKAGSPWTTHTVITEWMDHHCGPRAPERVAHNDHLLQDMTALVASYTFDDRRPMPSAQERLAARQRAKLAKGKAAPAEQLPLAPMKPEAKEAAVTASAMVAANCGQHVHGSIARRPSG
jgi:hypothetical protein